jgi:hypothetical protein
VFLDDLGFVLGGKHNGLEYRLFNLIVRVPRIVILNSFQDLSLLFEPVENYCGFTVLLAH